MFTMLKDCYSRFALRFMAERGSAAIPRKPMLTAAIQFLPTPVPTFIFGFCEPAGVVSRLN